MRPTIVSLGLALLLTACAVPVAFGPTPTPECTTGAFVAAIRPLFQRWEDASNLASRTSRVSLAPQIAELQSIRREAQELNTPVCAEEVRSSLVKSMDSTINGYLNFLANKPDDEVAVSFREAGAHLTTFVEGLSKMALADAAATAEAAP